MAITTVGVSFGQNKIQYPETKKGTTVDMYFDTPANDPFRWLEDDKSVVTGAWVKAENEVTYAYLDKIPFRNALKTRMEKLWNYEKISAPSTEGKFTYFSRNNGLQNQSVIYRKDKSG